MNRFFDWAYTSRYNPLYRSGVLASGLLFFVIITGLYLLFFYRLSTPFESIQNIQNNIWFGSLIRSLHRYASDLAVVAVFFHILRMVIEKKTWGPRVLAWISGIILLMLLFFSGWTGYVMVWDRHGQKLAIVGAKLIDSIGILAEPISRAFNGVSPIQSSFFFMNLFLHVAIPLGMILGLWIHTSRLARSKWFPENRVSISVVVALVILSIILPAPIAGMPNLFKIDGVEPTDWFFNFWMLLDGKLPPFLILSLILLFFLILASMPLWLRPFPIPGKSVHNHKKCEGCKQCAMDCPYDAILMVPRTEGVGSELVARVNEDLCVSCGICSGSCSQFAIGPVEKSSIAQLEAVKALRNTHSKEKGRVVILSCEQNFRPDALISWAGEKGVGVDTLFFPCSGNIHPAVVQALLLSYKGVFAITCAPDDCRNREGNWIFEERIRKGRSPSHPEKMPLEKIFITSGSLSDTDRFIKEFENFCLGLGPINQKTSKRQVAKAVLMTSAILSFIGYYSRKPMGADQSNSFIRLSMRVPRQTTKVCKKLTPNEVAKLPLHMRKEEECTLTSIKYKVSLELNSKSVLERQIHSQGVRHDKPMYVDEMLSVEPGQYNLKINFAPLKDLEEHKNVLRFEKILNVQAKAGHSVVVSWDANRGVYWEGK